MSSNKFPGWRYSAECPEGQVFNAAEDVPKGWTDDISVYFGKKPTTKAATKAAKGKAAAPPAPSARETLIASLVEVGYDADGLAEATDDELAQLLEAEQAAA